MNTLTIKAFAALLLFVAQPLAASSCALSFAGRDGDHPLQAQDLLIRLKDKVPSLTELIETTTGELAANNVKLRFSKPGEAKNATSPTRDEILVEAKGDVQDVKELIMMLAVVRHELIHTKPIDMVGFEGLSHEAFMEKMIGQLSHEEVEATIVHFETLKQASELAEVNWVELVPPKMLPIVKILNSKLSPADKRIEIHIKLAQLDAGVNGESYSRLWEIIAQGLWEAKQGNNLAREP